MTFILNSRF